MEKKFSHMKKRLFILLLALVSMPATIYARDSKFTRKGSGPLFWNVYGYCYDYNAPVPEDRWKKSIDWVAENLLSYGYNIVATDGWLYNPNSIDKYGYLTKPDDSWQHDFRYWSDYLKSQGLNLGLYYNPLWVPKASYIQNNKIINTSIDVSEIVGNERFDDNFYWVDTDKEGAEQWVKGCIRNMIDLGVTFLKIDFLCWYERDYGTARYIKALKWMAEEAGDDILLSLSMPNCRNNAWNELKYGDMFRTGSDCEHGTWYYVSEKRRGEINDSGQGDKYSCVFDGLVGWSDLAAKGQIIMDADFVRLNSMANAQEKQFWLSLLVMSGSAIGVADRYDDIGDCLQYYQNRELLELNQLGFVGKPISNDIRDRKNSTRWIGQLPNGDWVVGLFNREANASEMKIDFEKELGITNGDIVKMRDLWTHQDFVPSGSSYSVELAPHACQILRISTKTKKFKAASAALTSGAIIKR